MSDKVDENPKKGERSRNTNSSTGSKLVSTVWSEVIFAVTSQEAGVTVEMNLADDQILDAMRLKTSSLCSFPICYH